MTSLSYDGEPPDLRQRAITLGQPINNTSLELLAKNVFANEYLSGLKRELQQTASYRAIPVSKSKLALHKRGPNSEVAAATETSRSVTPSSEY